MEELKPHDKFKQILKLINSSLNSISLKAGMDNKDLYNKYEKLKALYRNAADEMSKGENANLQRVQFIINLITTDLEKDLSNGKEKKVK